MSQLICRMFYLLSELNILTISKTRILHQHRSIPFMNPYTLARLCVVYKTIQQLDCFGTKIGFEMSGAKPPSDYRQSNLKKSLITRKD